jgi:hypothetical protein
MKSPPQPTRRQAAARRARILAARHFRQRPEQVAMRRDRRFFRRHFFLDSYRREFVPGEATIPEGCAAQSVMVWRAAAWARVREFTVVTATGARMIHFVLDDADFRRRRYTPGQGTRAPKT